MAGLITFMNSTVGRVVRVILGLALIWLGLMGPLADSTGGVIVAIIGVVPVIMGIWGRCLMQFIVGGAKS